MNKSTPTPTPTPTNTNPNKKHKYTRTSKLEHLYKKLKKLEQLETKLQPYTLNHISQKLKLIKDDIDTVIEDIEDTIDNIKMQQNCLNPKDIQRIEQKRQTFKAIEKLLPLMYLSIQNTQSE